MTDTEEIVEVGSVWRLTVDKLPPVTVLVLSIEERRMEFATERNTNKVITMPVIHFLNLTTNKKDAMSYGRFTYVGELLISENSCG